MVRNIQPELRERVFLDCSIDPDTPVSVIRGETYVKHLIVERALEASNIEQSITKIDSLILIIKHFTSPLDRWLGVMSNASDLFLS